MKALSSAAPGNAQVTAGTDAGSTPARRLFATGMPSGVDAVWDDAAGVPVPGIARALEVLAAQVLDPAAAGLLPSSLVQLDQPEPDPAEPTAGTGRPAAAVGSVGGRPAYALAKPGEGFGLTALEDGTELGGSGTDAGVLPTAVALGPADGRELFAVGGEDGSVQVWDAVSGELLHGTAGGEGAQAVAAATVHGVPLAFSAGRAGEIRAWRTADGRGLGLLPVAGAGAAALCHARCADLDLLAAGSTDGLVRVWDTATGEQLHLLVGHTDRITALAVLTLGNQAVLASAGADATVRLWDLATGQPVAVLTGHSASVTGLAFLQPGGDPLLASCALDGTLRLWDVYTGTAVDGRPARQGWLTALAALHLDGRQVLAVGDEHGAVTLWDPTGFTRLTELAAAAATPSTR
ncbi:WD40 repeat domain-containing protein [Kitasatospora arboriphila]